MFESIISPDILKEHLSDPHWTIFDCRFDLADPLWGYQNYLEGHIPGAVFVDLDKDLSSSKTPQSGRHPLPNIERFIKKLSDWGVDETKQIVVYDTRSGAFSSRLWWLLQFLGHKSCAVLDGGYNAWKSAQNPVSIELPKCQKTTFIPSLKPELLISTEDLKNNLNNKNLLLIDARAPERYAGLQEPIDKIAGHIPGAVNLFHQENIREDGYFKSKIERDTLFKNLDTAYRNREIIVYCGSGVTSCLDLVSLYDLGVQNAKLYLGSWSEWIEDADRPIVTI